MSEFFVKL